MRSQIRTKDISLCVNEYEYFLARYKFVQSHFPDAKAINSYDPSASRRTHNIEFLSKSVNTNYTDVKFITKYNTLYIAPVVTLSFSHIMNGIEKIEDIVIGSSPKINRLAYIKYYSNAKGSGKPAYQSKIAFSRFMFNMKKYNFNESIFNSCRSAIMQFIQENSGIPMDDKHLEPRLKKLLIYT